MPITGPNAKDLRVNAQFRIYINLNSLLNDFALQCIRWPMGRSLNTLRLGMETPESLEEFEHFILCLWHRGRWCFDLTSMRLRYFRAFALAAAFFCWCEQVLVKARRSSASIRPLTSRSPTITRSRRRGLSFCRIRRKK